MMKINEILVENYQPKYPVKLDSKYGGGTIDKIIDQTSASIIYYDNLGNIEIKINITKNKKQMLTKNDKIGQLMNVSARDMIKIFDDYVVRDICSNFEKYLNKKDPYGDRTLNLTKKINNLKETKMNNSEVISTVRTMLNPIMKDLYELADKFDKKEFEEVNEDSVNYDTKKTKLRKSADEVENLISEDDEDK